jgi:DNA processing protein
MINTISPEFIFWLAALYFPNIGRVKLRRYLEYFNDIKKIFSASIEELHLAGLTQKEIHSIKNPNWKSAEKDLRWCEKNNCHIITWCDERYPSLLREIYDAPMVLFVRGDPQLLSTSQMAMVGSRKPTATGYETAENFASELARSNFVVTSGMALGIDAASHKGALRSGKTIAVLGAGLQHIYPPSHHKLADQIIESGALVSEFLPDEPPKASHFPLRNRIISGLSVGVLVVEAALKSGSLITARNAIEQGREVFAIPGSIHNPLSRGCHHLIRLGAKLVETADDIFEELGALVEVAFSTKSKIESPQLNEKQQQLLNQIGYEITSLDAIIARSGLTTGEVSSILLSLELVGYVQIAPGGYVRAANKFV